MKTSYEYYLEKFNSLQNVVINYDIMSLNCIDIRNSYEIKDDELKMHFLNHISQFVNFKKRDIYSLFIEWKAHNILYNKKIFRKRTADTGLNDNESWIRRFFYRIVCFIFNEK